MVINTLTIGKVLNKFKAKGTSINIKSPMQTIPLQNLSFFLSEDDENITPKIVKIGMKGTNMIEIQKTDSEYSPSIYPMIKKANTISKTIIAKKITPDDTKCVYFPNFFKKLEDFHIFGSSSIIVCMFKLLPKPSFFNFSLTNLNKLGCLEKYNL